MGHHPQCRGVLLDVHEKGRGGSLRGSFQKCWQCTAVPVPPSVALHVSPPEGANEQWRGSGCLEHAEGAQVWPGLCGHRCVGAAPGQTAASLVNSFWTKK